MMQQLPGRPGTILVVLACFARRNKKYFHGKTNGVFIF